MNEKGLSTLKICEQKLKVLNYSLRTKICYLRYIDLFLKSQEKSAAHLNSKDFQYYLDNYQFTSISQQNQIINAIRFLYNFGLNKKYDKVSFKRPNKEKKLPRVIDDIFIKEQLSKIENQKHKTILSLTYSVGLRVSEVINLKITDIDSKRMIIHIKNAKGRKDRIVPLSENILKLLRGYFTQFRPKEYLFNGQATKKYSAGSCNQLVKKYLGNEYHMHLLRHSCFTNLLENGTDIRIIQKIAGHSNIKTTECYTHVSNVLLKSTKLPI
jgi:integrase/recombinase XerD